MRILKWIGVSVLILGSLSLLFAILFCIFTMLIISQVINIMPYILQTM